MARIDRDRLALGLLAIAALGLGLAGRIDYDEDLDSLRFSLGVEHFDAAALRPHAPFYPVYVAAAKVGVLLGASPRGALAWLSAIAGAALAVMIALLGFELFGRRAAAIAGILGLASPLLRVSAEKLMSDVPGAALIAASLWLFARARRLPERAPALRTAAVVILGVSLGVRLSYFPFALAGPILAARAEGGGRATLARARDLATGVVLWLVPLLVVSGPREILAASLAQGRGHFTRWGGSALTVSSPATRILGTAWGLWANVLAGPWSDTPRLRWITAPILVAFLLAAARRSRSLRASIDAQPELWVGAALYFVWAFLGQNVAFKPRHLLPLAAPLLVALAAGADALAERSRLALAPALILAALWLADGAALVAAHRDPSPAAALVAFVDRAPAPPPVLTFELGPMLIHGAPRASVIDTAEALDRLLAGEIPPGGAWLTGEALSPEARRALAARGALVTPIFSRSRSRYVDPLWSDLTLWQVRLPAN